jgi:hypothetical protein
MDKLDSPIPGVDGGQVPAGAAAAGASMRGDHRPMVVALLTVLNQHI